MILSVGEILADMIGEKTENGISYTCLLGGAPFNLAFNAKQAGAKVAFIGKVGKDGVGDFLKATAKKANLDVLTIQTDNDKNTTLAFVTLTDGERDFNFFRRGTADYSIDVSDLNLADFDGLNIVHLGSLMLSEKEGKKVAKKVAKMTKKAGKLLSFDLNFRHDIFGTPENARKAYKPYIDSADIVKFSEEELTEYTGLVNFDDAVNAVKAPNKLIVVTLGAKGSSYYYNDLSGTIPTEPIKPIDTTGAGDAFFGTLLACLDGKEFTKENLENALIKANKAGAETTQFKGAIKL